MPLYLTWQLTMDHTPLFENQETFRQTHIKGNVKLPNAIQQEFDT
ncbi:hypothetical protein [Flagellimonas sp. GZD32]